MTRILGIDIPLGRRRGRTFGAAAIACAMLTACGGDSTDRPDVRPDPGVLFTYPADGQLDVPVGARIVVGFSEPIEASSLAACSGESGSFCVVGPSGAITDQPLVTGPDGTAIHMNTTTLEPGTEYRVFVRSAVLPAAVNLSDTDPLITFRTRSKRPLGQVAPAILALDGAPAERFAPGASETPAALLDFDTVRLVFTEPLDTRTLIYGQTIELLDGAGALVPATLSAQSIHASIDPSSDMAPGDYTVRLSAGVLDVGGEAMDPIDLSFAVIDSTPSGDLIDQQLIAGNSADVVMSPRSGAEIGSVHMVKPLIGEETLRVVESSLTAQIGDAEAFGGPIPIVIRRGEQVNLSELDVKLGGKIPAGLATGEISVVFASDASGFIRRNPFRPADTIPHNDASPVHIELTFDIVVSARDALGNAVLNQTVLGVQTTGTGVARDGALTIETVGAMELDFLGVTVAPSNMSLALSTDKTAVATPDTTGPGLVSSYPANGAAAHPVADGIALTFDEPVDKLGAAATIALEDIGGNPVAFDIESQGTTVVLRPNSILPYGMPLFVTGTVVDFRGNESSAFSLDFQTPSYPPHDLPLVLSSLYPGVPCLLTDTGGGGGRCDHGLDSDELYSPFTLPANNPVVATFNQPVDPTTAVLGSACDDGSVRVELMEAGVCTGVVPGVIRFRERGFEFTPYEPWVEGQTYRVALVAGDDEDCDAGELCGANGVAFNPDPLDGLGDNNNGGGDNSDFVIIDFTGASATTGVFLFAETVPFSDINGSGFVEGGELDRDENRAAVRIVGVNDNLDFALFEMEDCLPNTPEVEGCMYMSGGMPVVLGELENDCALADGTTAPDCLPVTILPQVMYGTSLRMDAELGGIGVTEETGTNIIRVREPAAGGPIVGHIVDAGGIAEMVVRLDIYMDAPDLSLPLGTDHDIESKPLSLLLRGPVGFFDDGRVKINLANVEPVSLNVDFDPPLISSGSVDMEIPAGEMKLQLLSRPRIGAER